MHRIDEFFDVAQIVQRKFKRIGLQGRLRTVGKQRNTTHTAGLQTEHLRGRWNFKQQLQAALAVHPSQKAFYNMRLHTVHMPLRKQVRQRMIDLAVKRGQTRPLQPALARMPERAARHERARRKPLVI